MKGSMTRHLKYVVERKAIRLNIPVITAHNELFMLTLWILHAVCVIDLLWGELTGHQWISIKSPVTLALNFFMFTSTTCWVSNRDASDSCHHDAHVMMTSSNGNIFRVTGPLCGEFTGPGEFPTQRPVTRSFDVFFDLRPPKPLSKQLWGWWFETLSRSLWRHRNGNTTMM